MSPRSTPQPPRPPGAHLVTQGLVGGVEQHQGLQHIPAVVEGPLTCGDPALSPPPPQNRGAAPRVGLIPWRWDGGGHGTLPPQRGTVTIPLPDTTGPADPLSPGTRFPCPSCRGEGGKRGRQAGEPLLSPPSSAASPERSQGGLGAAPPFLNRREPTGDLFSTGNRPGMGGGSGFSRGGITRLSWGGHKAKPVPVMARGFPTPHQLKSAAGGALCYLSRCWKKWPSGGTQRASAARPGCRR